MSKLAGTIHTEAYQALLTAIVDARSRAGLSQARLAERLNKPASFVGKYELGERRLDVIEFLVILGCLEIDVGEFLTDIQSQLPERL